MRSFVPAAAAVATALLIAASPARAQDEGPPTAPSPPRAEAAPPPAAETPPTEASAPPAREAEHEPATAPAPSPKKPKPAAPKPAAPVATPAPRASPGARLAPGQAIPRAELEAFVDGQVRAAMARDHIAGVAVAVVQNGEILLKKGYGFASLAPQRPVDPDRTLFRLGPLSATFTWIGLMKAAETGRIRLDQPIDRYLPPNLRLGEAGSGQPVRGLDLMDHSAGFEDRTLGHFFEQNPDYVRPLDLYLRQERPARVRQPGQVASYSSYGAALAGAAEASVAGKTFERLMEEEIFLPLGMRHTTFREKRPAKAGLPAPMPAALAPETADGFRWTANGFEPSPYEYLGQVAPAASASSTAGDMARYMLALLGGGQLGGVSIYGPRTAQAFRTPILATPPGINGWAHGFAVEPLPGGHAGYGGGGATLAFAARLVTAPDLNLGVFVAANTDTGAGLVDALPGAVVQAFYAPPAAFPRPGAPQLVREADRYAGRYLTTRRAYSGLRGFVGRIAGAAEVRVTPQGRLVTRGAAGPQIWVPEDASGENASGEGAPGEGRFIARQGEARLAFRMAGGAATAFRTSPNAQLFERVGFWRSPAALGLMALLAAAAAVVTLGGAALRDGRELRENAAQRQGGLVQNIQAGLWLLALAAFGVWRVRDLPDPARLALHWPGGALVTASACALVAAALTFATLFALPGVWRGGRRLESWPVLRRAAFTLTVAIYAAFSILLAQAGALSPWSG